MILIVVTLEATFYFLVVPMTETWSELLPSKSKKSYLKCWLDFQEWCTKEEIFPTGLPEKTTFFRYFRYLVKNKYAASSLWTKYSSIKSVVHLQFGADLKTYCPEIVPLLKAFKRTYRSYQESKNIHVGRDDTLLFLPGV